MSNSPVQFEFLSCTKPDLCIADGIIHDGLLLPLNYRRCESEGTGKSRIKSSKLAKEHQKLRRATSQPAAAAAQQYVQPRTRRPRWYWLAFSGSIRAPTTNYVDIKDMKIRQNKRSTTVVDETECSGGWRVVRSLSCKAAADVSTAVMPLKGVM